MFPLSNIKVIELAGLAPVPLCGMILSDFGARVIRIDNVKANMTDEVLSRGKESMFLDLKQTKHLNVFKRLVRCSDVLLDPYRPGVLEKLKLSPNDLHLENPNLIIARLTGYGQLCNEDSKEVAEQKLRAGHDINYVGYSGVLSKLVPPGSIYPQPPINILGDFAGGALMCAFGIASALYGRERTGRGEVIDCSMTQGCAYLSSFLWRSRDLLPLAWPEPERKGRNLLDGGAPFYRCYATKDDKFVAVGAIEPQFYWQLLQILDLHESTAPQFDHGNWPELSRKFAEIFLSRTRAEWMERVKEFGDCCVTPVLELDEAAEFWNQCFVRNDGHFEPRPSPVLSTVTMATASEATAMGGDGSRNRMVRPQVGGDTLKILQELGYSASEIIDIVGDVRAKI